MADGFIVAVASGKGGTGKTTIATNMAKLYAERDTSVQYLDCDVEEPNGHLFLKPTITNSRDVAVEVPDVDADKCTQCGQCGEICQYSAIVAVGGQVLTFDPLCHSCAGCWRVCPAGAISPKPLTVGCVQSGHTGALEFIGGQLEVGYVRTPSVIHQLKQDIGPESLAIVDVPPGTACPVVAALRGVDFVLLVTEPTPFGLNDLKLAVGLVREMGLPFAVVINRQGVGSDATEAYCRVEGIDIAAMIPDDRSVAEAYSSGQMVVEAVPTYREVFGALCDYLDGVRRSHVK